MKYEYYTPSKDKPGIYLLLRKTNCFNDQETYATKYWAKVGMSYAGACQRAKHQAGHCNYESLYNQKGKYLGYLCDFVEVIDIKYFEYFQTTESEIRSIERCYHEAMHYLGNQIGFSEWHEVPLQTYNDLKKYGLPYVRANIADAIEDEHILCYALTFLSRVGA